MKRLNKKGFTLIELLAVIIILGILLLVAVPSISRSINLSKKGTYENNLITFVRMVKTEVTTGIDSIYNMDSKDILYVDFACIELEDGDNSKSPFAEYEVGYVKVLKNADASITYSVHARDKSGYGVINGVVDSKSPTVEVVGSLKNTDVGDPANASGAYYIQEGKCGTATSWAS